MKIKINDKIQSISQIQVAEMNFGREFENLNEIKLNYEFEISFEEFKTICSDIYENYRIDQINEKIENETFPLDSLWKKYQIASFPKINECFNFNKDLLSDLINFLAYDYLHKIINNKLTTNFYLIINTKLVIVNSSILFSGDCVERKMVF